MNFFSNPPDGSPLVLGHRGNPARHPDNTLAGIMSGLAHSDGVEVDVRMSSDGHLVLAHDAAIGGHVVSETEWAVLAELDIGDGHRPCQLDALTPLEGRVDLEVKNLPGEPGFHEDGRLALLVAARARPGDVVTSFYWPDMDLIRRRAPHVQTGLLVGREGEAADALEHCLREGHGAVALEHNLADDHLVAEAVRHGVGVICWTVNQKTRAIELAQRGVSAIISDQPETIKDGFREEGH